MIETPAARQKRVWDKAAPSYDKQMAFFEKIQFGGGREWPGERARGRVLESASRTCTGDSLVNTSKQLWPTAGLAGESFR